VKGVRLNESTADFETDLAASAAEFIDGRSALTHSSTAISVRGPTYRLEVTGNDLVLDTATRVLQSGGVIGVDLFKVDTIIASSAFIPISFKGGAKDFLVTTPLSLMTLFSTIGEPTALVIHGSSDDDTLVGGIYPDTLFGNGGNDVIWGAGSNDVIHAGRGLDTAAYAGPMASYQIRIAPGFELVVEDLRPGAPDGTDQLHDIDRIQFSDVTVSAYDLMFNAGSPSVATSSEVYRFTNVETGIYFYTNDPFERDYLLLYPNQTPMRLDGIAFGAHAARGPKDVPVFRFANESNGAFFLTASPEERDWVLANRPDMRLDYSFFFEPDGPGDDATPVYRLANLVDGSYLYTVKVEDRDYVMSLGTWRDEGVGFYSPLSSAQTSPLPDLLF